MQDRHETGEGNFWAPDISKACRDCPAITPIDFPPRDATPTAAVNAGVAGKFIRAGTYIGFTYRQRSNPDRVYWADLEFEPPGENTTSEAYARQQNDKMTACRQARRALGTVACDTCPAGLVLIDAPDQERVDSITSALQWAHEVRQAAVETSGEVPYPGS